MPASTPDAGPVRLERRGRVAVVTIDRPAARNAVDVAVAHGIEAAVDEVERDDDLWCGVLAGTPPVFCAGADLRAIDAGLAEQLSTPRGGFGGFVVRARSKPFVAAVDGPAFAGGFELVLACDLVVASTAASFALPEVKRCLLAGGGGMFRLPRLVPRNIAMELLLTGAPIDAGRAHALGLVNRVVPAGTAVDGAAALAEVLNENAPLAVRATRRLVLESEFDDDATALARSDDAYRSLAGSADLAEGLRAFVEKREPIWAAR